ncbi:hypothetical protein CYY_010074 [Polysphondylium violaceum]|uniref:Carbohydrate binding domain-containing protein n=1 Tax=Polysphondylium violaceum TaxID=133409 RepID=A0A8J4PLY4_9MYCE|nr:hypothetical protein CYY_010074 [Polysphondylium violaceum]
MMKLSIISLILLIVAVASANTAADPQPHCSVGQVSVWRNQELNCVLLTKCTFIGIVQTLEKEWTENGSNYALVRVHVVNYGTEFLKSITIATDSSLNLRDQGSIWNIQYNNNELSLPTYSTGVAPSGAFSFGYVIRGTVSPRMYIKSLTY